MVAPGVGRFASQVADGAREVARTGAAYPAGSRPASGVKATTSGRATLLGEGDGGVGGTFEEDVPGVRRVREAAVAVGLLGCVAGGIDEVGRQLGLLADGAVGPARWRCRGARSVWTAPGGSRPATPWWRCSDAKAAGGWPPSPTLEC
jgi:hypothetical protein